MHVMLGARAMYRVLEPAGDLVEVQVVQAPNLPRRRPFWLRAAAVRAMTAVRSPNDLADPAASSQGRLAGLRIGASAPG